MLKSLLFVLFFLFLHCFVSAQESEQVIKNLQEEFENLKQKFETQEKLNKELQNKINQLEGELERLKLQLPEEGFIPEKPPITQQTSANIFNPQATVFLNTLWRIDDRKMFLVEDDERERIDDSFILRDVEVDLRAPVDPYIDAVFIFAGEQDAPGEMKFDAEEAYAIIKNLPFFEKPPLGLRLKVGRFNTEFGRYNLLHTHDMPQLTRPRASEMYLGEEGYRTLGLSAQMYIPTPFDKESVLELTTQLLQGGEILLAEDGRNEPAYLANLRWSRTFSDEHNFDVSAIYHHAFSDKDSKMPVETYSLDFLYKWKPLRMGEWKSFLAGGQLFYSDRRYALSQEDGFIQMRSRPLGYFLWTQYQFDRNFYAGVRFDYTEDMDFDKIKTKSIQPYLTYYLSEFSRFRVGWEHRWSDNLEWDDSDTIFFEFNFVFGSHPPEPFWVNR